MTITSIVIISALGGGLLTGGALYAIEARSNKWEDLSIQQSEVIDRVLEVQNSIHMGEIDLQKNLTAPDLLEIPCSSEYMANNGEGLCREMFCRLQTREGDGASQSECEEIANLNNTISIIETCKANEMEIDKCLKVLDTRK
jgi:hypothetical protein